MLSPALTLSELQQVLQGLVNPPLCFLHLADVEVNVKGTVPGAAVEAAARLRAGCLGGVGELPGPDVPEVEGDDVDALPVPGRAVPLARALDQHHVVAGLDDGAVRVAARETSWKRGSNIQSLFAKSIKSFLL